MKTFLKTEGTLSACLHSGTFIISCPQIWPGNCITISPASQAFDFSLSTTHLGTSQHPWGFPDGSVGKEPAYSAGDSGSIPGLRRSPGEGKGYPLQFSGLENPMDCIVHGVPKSQTGLRGFHFHFHPP